MRRPAHHSITVLFLAAQSALSENPRLIDGFDKKDFHEYVPVGGVYVIGVMAGEGRSAANPENLYVSVPNERHARLCVTVTSIDGRYHTKGVFAIDQTPSGKYPLEFNAPNRKVVREYSPGEVVLDGRVGADCNEPEKLKNVAMGWTLDTLSSKTLTLYVNAEEKDAVVQIPSRSDPNKITSVPCQRISSKRPTTAFATACVLDRLETLDVSGAWLELRRVGRIITSEPLGILSTTP